MGLDLGVRSANFDLRSEGRWRNTIPLEAMSIAHHPQHTANMLYIGAGGSRVMTSNRKEGESPAGPENTYTHNT